MGKIQNLLRSWNRRRGGFNHRVSHALFCQRKLAVGRRRVGDFYGDVEYSFRFVARSFVLSARAAKAENGLEFGFSVRLFAGSNGVACAAILESQSGLSASADRALAYHLSLASIPVFLLILWLALSNQPNLSEETNLFWRITNHAGAGILSNVSSHLLVASHVFLETIHYAAWILLIPLVDRRAIPWKLKEIPLASNRNGFAKIVFAVLAISIVLVIALWFGFASDYTTTRDIYFAFAIAHVLAEFPFLIKML
jgi:hypothetical protein